MRRHLQSLVCPGLLLAMLVTVFAPRASAHAVLMESKPKAASSVKGPDVPLWLRYNVRVDGKRSRLQLMAPDGTATTVLIQQTAPDILQSHVTGLKPGAYKLQWRVLASDGHMSSGEVDFTVN